MDWGFFRPSRTTLSCLFLLSIAFLLMAFRLTHTVQSMRSFLFYWISPTYSAVTATVDAGQGLGARIMELILAHRENQILKERSKHFPLVESELDQVRAENERLKSLLNFKSELGFETIPAQVSGRDTQNWSAAVWINQGTEGGVLPNSPVLAIEGDPLENVPITGGIVGRILETGLHSSKLILISDPLSSVAVSIKRTGEQGLLQGHRSYAITVEYLDQLGDVQPGDEVVTNGLGGIFPAGLSVGTITEVESLPQAFKRAHVKPTVPLGRIREVLILKRKEKQK